MDGGMVIASGAGSIRVVKDGVVDARAASMACDADGAVWLAYVTGGLTCIRDGRAKIVVPAEQWPPSAGSSLATDAQGSLWFAKGNSIGVFRDGKFQTLPSLEEPVSCIGRRQSGGIWVCAGKRLLKFEEGHPPQEWARLEHGADTIEPRTVIEDRDGAVWIGTAGSGLFRCASVYSELIPTSYRDITCLTEDREGNIWPGTGRARLNPPPPRLLSLT